MSTLLLYTGLLGRWRLWRYGIDGLSDADKRRLHAISERSTEIDVFISHSWNTNGLLKILHLQLRWCWLGAVTCASVGAAVLGLLQYYSMLPQASLDWSFSLFSRGDFDAGRPDSAQHATVWLPMYRFVTPLILAVAGLLLQPMLPKRWQRDLVFFLDAVSICQHDEQEKRRGIQSLEMVLVNSKSMQVLWSDDYLTRLWCVFELAIFLKQGRPGCLSVTPVLIEARMLAVAGCVLLGSAVDVFAGMALHMDPLVSFVVSALARLPLLISFSKLRQSIHAVKKQLAELPTFDVRTTYCKLDSDREFVESRIIAWYGSLDIFNSYVRAHFQHSLAQRIGLPYMLTLLSIAVPLLFSCTLGRQL